MIQSHDEHTRWYPTRSWKVETRVRWSISRWGLRRSSLSRYRRYCRVSPHREEDHSRDCKYPKISSWVISPFFLLFSRTRDISFCAKDIFCLDLRSRSRGVENPYTLAHWTTCDLYRCREYTPDCSRALRENPLSYRTLSRIDITLCTHRDRHPLRETHPTRSDAI